MEHGFAGEHGRSGSEKYEKNEKEKERREERETEEMRSAMGDRLEDICVSESQIQRGRQKWQKYYRLRNVNSANYNTKSRGGNRELKPRLINSGERARFVFVPLNSSLEERSRPLCCEIARARSAWLCCNRQETRYPKKVSKISEVREIA